MNTETLSSEAEQFYADHRMTAIKLGITRQVIKDCQARIGRLRSGLELTSYGLGGEYADHQADIIATNLDKHEHPRAEREKADYNSNLTDSASHFRENEEAYKTLAVELALAAGKEVNYPPFTDK